MTFNKTVQVKRMAECSDLPVDIIYTEVIYTESNTAYIQNTIDVYPSGRSGVN